MKRTPHTRRTGISRSDNLTRASAASASSWLTELGSATIRRHTSIRLRLTRTTPTDTGMQIASTTCTASDSPAHRSGSGGRRGAVGTTAACVCSVQRVPSHQRS